MPKPLSQISFDFSTENSEQDEQLPVVNEDPSSANSKELSLSENDTVKKEGTELHQQVKPKPKGRRSLKQSADDPVELPSDEILFQKTYYPIGEVAAMFGVNQSLLRYWESEFDILKPRKNGKGDRYFRPQDVKNLQLIHDLLRRRKYTIEGAKTYLKHNAKKIEDFDIIRSLEKMKAFLLELKASL
jgi:DNA-binding transcriptional MerR regulator